MGLGENDIILKIKQELILIVIAKTDVECDRGEKPKQGDKSIRIANLFLGKKLLDKSPVTYSGKDTTKRMQHWTLNGAQDSNMFCSWKILSWHWEIDHSHAMILVERKQIYSDGDSDKSSVIMFIVQNDSRRPAYQNMKMAQWQSNNHAVQEYKVQKADFDAVTEPTTRIGYQTATKTIPLLQRK